MSITQLKLLLKRKIRQSAWFADVKRQCLKREAEALLDIAADVSQTFELYRNDEINKGKFIWAIRPTDATDVWMSSFKTKKACLRLCKEMAWTVVK